MTERLLAGLARHHLLLTACCLWSGLMLIGISVTRPDVVPAFASYASVAEKKTAFFDYMRTYAEQVNQRVRADRTRLLAVTEKYAEDGTVPWLDRFFLTRLEALYLPAEIHPNADSADSADSTERTEERLNILLRRVDVVPISLALVQAAKESGWGTSRFAQRGYNFFGHQCFDVGCGFKPKRRATGRRHEVARFPDTENSVRAYVHNLNTHPRYQKFRQMRAAARARQEPLSGVALAAGLLSYSERGQAYVDEVQNMIRANDLE